MYSIVFSLNETFSLDFFCQGLRLSICQLLWILHVRWIYNHFFENFYLLVAFLVFYVFPWLFNLMLNGVSLFSTRCELHIVHSSRQMTYSILQFVLLNIFQILLLCWLLNDTAVFTCFQHILRLLTSMLCF